MFGLNNAIRSAATGFSATVDTGARSLVKSMVLGEKALDRRLTDEHQARLTLALQLESVKDLQETCKSCGFKSLEEGIEAVKKIDELLKK